MKKIMKIEGKNFLVNNNKEVKNNVNVILHYFSNMNCIVLVDGFPRTVERFFHEEEEFEDLKILFFKKGKEMFVIREEDGELFTEVNFKDIDLEISVQVENVIEDRLTIDFIIDNDLL